MSTVINNSHNRRVLIWSQRNIQNYIFNSCLYEFENLIGTFDSATMVTPPQYNFYNKSIRKIVKTNVKYFEQLAYVNPYLDRYTLEDSYDIFFSIIDFPYNLSFINLLDNWRQKSKLSVCYIIEIWQHDIPKLKNFIKFFQNFDLICLGHFHVVDEVEKILGRPCIYLAPGVDAAKFCPQHNGSRGIDLSSLGRRSEITHQALLELAEKQKFFYYYDSIVGGGARISNYQAHRTLISNLLKNSRYFITNRAKVNLANQTKGQQEIGYRFFEGAAAGSVLLGCSPKSETFQQYFDWNDAVIPIAFNEPNIGEVIAELDAQPEYLQKIRIDNVVNSLKKHDWVHRWEQILNAINVPITPSMKERKKHLHQLGLEYSGKKD